MNTVLVLGSGAREHVIAEKLAESPNVKQVYVYPGNSGMQNKKIIKIKINNIINYCNNIENNIDMVVIGPEKYLVEGFVDKIKIKCFGPSHYASLIEGSKSFSKKFMFNNDIPTADYRIFMHPKNAIDFLKIHFKNNYVIKASGLAGGKGVFIPNSLEEAINNVYQLMVNKQFGNAGNVIVIEEKLFGQEVSVLGFCNGHDIVLMPQAQDYKGLYQNGPNTGGMGSHAPVNILTEEELLDVKYHMLKVVRQLKYKGVLYAGLMKTQNGIQFLEFNCRFGDPEAQVLLNLLDYDLYDIFYNCILGNEIQVKWKPGYASNVVLSHKDYPFSKSNELLPINIGDYKNVKVYWSNVEKVIGSNKLQTNGGRVASMVCYDMNFYKSINTIYNNIYKINYKDMYYRRDIGLNKLTKHNRRKLKIAILGSTKGSSSQLLINQIKKKELNASIEVIISNRKNAYILERAKQSGISFIYLPCKKGMKTEDYDRKIVNLLRTYDIDLVYLIGYMKIVSNVLIDEYRGNIFNIHPSLLPKYNGLMDMTVHDMVIQNNDKYTGCTLHHVELEVDGGDIILQRQLKVDTKDINELKRKVQELEQQVIVDSVKIWSNLNYNYKNSGVDIDKGNQLVESIKDISDEIGGFCAIYNHKNIKFAASTDGVGTKIELAIQANNYSTIGIDLVAMSVNDLFARGVKPLFFLDYLAVDSLNVKKTEELIRGIQMGCEIADCKLIGGETAEMKGIYYKDKFDMAGFAVGEVIDKYPKQIKKGDYIYGIKSNGVHSNGYTLIRKLLKYSDYDLNELLKPTRIYIEILDIIKKYKDSLLGMAHITGGGFTDNIPRILPKGLSFKLEKINFPDVFKWIQKESNMSYQEMLRTYNCGYGMILIFNKQIDDFDYLGRVV